MKNFCGFIIRFDVLAHFYDFVIHEYKCSLFLNLHFLFFIFYFNFKKEKNGSNIVPILGGEKVLHLI